jgi:DivIVA domain-containing protein
MTWFFAVLVVLLMGVVAVVAAGVGGSMAEVYDDRPDSRVQADGPLTAEDLRRVRFTSALRGYRMSEVDALLERLAIELEAARAETRRLQGNPDVSGSETRRDQGRPTEGKGS